jgi:hypothetical protein
MYRSKWFIVFGFLTIVMAYFALTRFSTHFSFQGPQYVGLYDLHPEKLLADRFWYLRQLQPPNWIYLKNLFHYFPHIAISVTTLLLLMTTKREKINYFLLTFIGGGLIIMAVYKIEYSLKYLWWFLPFFYALLVVFLQSIKARHRLAYFAIILIIIGSQIPGVLYVLTRHYGSNEQNFPVLMNTHVESYYPDDKTPVEQLVKYYRPGDIIITDYFIQDIYLELLINRKSDFYISSLSGEEFANTYVVYKYYKEVDYWRLSKNGPIIMKGLTGFKKILADHKNHRIWYVSGSDFVGRQNQYISSPDVISYLNNDFKSSVVYTGQDGNSKLYLIE